MFRAIRSILMLVALCGLALSVFAGCTSSPFKTKEPRSQYQRYEELRGRGRDATTTNAFGAQEKNLRERLHNTVRQFAHVEREERVAKDALEIARELAPEHPVLCFSHTALERRAKLFLNEFPGFVTYAVKANCQTCS